MLRDEKWLNMVANHIAGIILQIFSLGLPGGAGGNLNAVAFRNLNSTKAESTSTNDKGEAGIISTGGGAGAVQSLWKVRLSLLRAADAILTSCTLLLNQLPPPHQAYRYFCLFSPFS